MNQQEANALVQPSVGGSKFLPILITGKPRGQRYLPASPPAAANAAGEFSTQKANSPVISADPLYLFCCGLQWQKKHDTSAGWDLIHSLHSWDPVSRALALTILSSTDKVQLKARELRRARARQAVWNRTAVPLVHRLREVTTMKIPYGSSSAGSCVNCRLRRPDWFCSFSPENLKPFSGATRPGLYSGGTLLFVEGQMPRGAFVLCSGRVKLTATSREGKMLMLKVAEPGEVLGLSAAISGSAYQVTAETVGPCQLNFLEREALLRMMEKNGEIGLRAAHALSHEFQSMYRDVHDLVLARSSAGKLARLLLSWIAERTCEPVGNELRIHECATHEEMAQMIGASRETVTRLLSHLKKKDLIRLEGSTLVIRNRNGLEALSA